MIEMPHTRHVCRTCRARLPEPLIEDQYTTAAAIEHSAFCCRGCWSAFYRRHCLVCERETAPAALRPSGLPVRNLCGRSCCNAFARAPALYEPQRFRKPPSGTGTAGSPQNASRSAHFMGLQSALAQCRGSRFSVPLNLLGGYRWPNVDVIEESRRQTIIHAEIDDTFVEAPAVVAEAAE
jgi:hypothetical protein